MDNNDFSSGFDTLMNSFSGVPSTIDLNFDEYEKSVFLTKAQEDEVLSLYTGRNAIGNGFEATEELRRYLANLLCEATIEPISSEKKPKGMDSKQSYFFLLPNGTNTPAVWFITYEYVSIAEDYCGANSIDVVPVRQDEYNRLRKNPFRGVNNRRALRLDMSDNIIEIVCKFPVTGYYVRYLRKPKPIILINLGEDQSIQGISEATPSEVHEALHQMILERAVLLALQSRGYTANNNRENR